MRYIPKDAVAVAGVNLKALSKKIAWNLITGSKLFKEMQDRIPEKSTKDAMNGIEKAGIDVLNTFYVYVKTDTRFKGGSRITGLVPLSDAGQWEQYVKDVFPKAEIRQKGDRKEASLGRDMYVGWNKNLLIIINVSSVSSEGDEMAGQPKLNITSKMDQDDISAEMENAFSVSKENSLINNTRFTALETKGHDVTIWLNYEEMMTEYGQGMADKMSGISLSNSLWKGADFAAGFDFVKGKITGDMQYFLPDQMKGTGADFGGTNADKDMVERLPGDKMDFALTMHISPKGVKESLEKMGFLGLANETLETQGLSVDTLLGAFTGDMALEMNDFSLKTEKVQEPFMGQMVTHDVQKPAVSVSFVMKLNKKENFMNLLKLIPADGFLNVGNGIVRPLDDKDSLYLLHDDQYFITSNKLPYAQGFLKGTFRGQKKTDEVSFAAHPWSFYLDVTEFMKNIDPGITHSAHDSVLLAESKKLVHSVCFSGGEYNNEAFDYHLDVNFVNTEENSIIDLMDFGMKVSDAEKLNR